MAKEKRVGRKGKKRKLEWSKVMTLLVILFGFIIAQEALFLMFLCIRNEYTSAAAWLTAAVGLAEAIIGTGLTGYLSLCKTDHSEGGITYERAKASNFKEATDESPPI